MTDSLKVKNLIIGAGPCGLGAAWDLFHNNELDFLVIEKESYPGGLATSFVDDEGFTWDIGGHVQFSHYDYFDKVMNEALGGDGWLHHLRSSWVWMKNRFIPYPFQNNIHRLPDDSMNECLEGLESRDESKKLTNFKDWLEASFGSGICKHFLYPYNFKVWAYDPSTMNFSWIGERVSTIDIERIKKNIKENTDDVSWGPNNKFHFPKEGGTGAIWKAVAKKIPTDHFQYNVSLEKVDSFKKEVTLSNGSVIEYENLLSSIPLDKLCEKIDSKELYSTASKLKYSSTHVIGLGVEGKVSKELSDKCWMYFPEEDCPFYRVTVFSNYSPNNVPDSDKYFSLMAEVSESSDKNVDTDKIIEETLQGAINTQLIDKNSKVVSKWHIRMEYGYPTPSLDRDNILKKVIPVLDEKNIYSRGRFGGWKYEVSNQDHTFMQGVEWAQMILNNTPEETFTV
ncbi:MAG: FAD-dependent oxidoreductase [Bacteriovoracaceae bacterium]|nr:FAD-dependent oxidoreductase [Bacteriovoracaceae bacterium]